MALRYTNGNVSDIGVEQEEKIVKIPQFSLIWFFAGVRTSPQPTMCSTFTGRKRAESANDWVML